MHRCLWVNVLERQADVVFVNDVRRDFPVHDLGENGFRHDDSLLMS